MYKKKYSDKKNLLCHDINTNRKIIIALLLLQFFTIQPTIAQEREYILRQSPNTSSPHLGFVSNNDIENYSVKAINGNWLKIELHNGTVGFVHKDHFPPLSTPTSKAFELNIIDVGTGLSIFGVSPLGTTFIYDAGSIDVNSKNLTVEFINKYYPSVRSIDYLIISHPHKDHISYIPKIFDTFSVRNIIFSGEEHPSCIYQKVLTSIQNANGNKYVMSANRKSFVSDYCSDNEQQHVDLRDSLPISTLGNVHLGPDTFFTILQTGSEQHSRANHNSLVVKVTSNERSVLLTGDIEAGRRADVVGAIAKGSSMANLINCCSQLLAADILIVPQHGSLTSTRSKFIELVKAESYVISSGPKKFHQHVLPDQETVLYLQEKGKVLRTDKHDTECTLNQYTPGGCSDILIEIDEDSTISTEYRNKAG